MLNTMNKGIRSPAAKFVLFTFLVLAVGGMVLMDVGGFFRNGAQPNTVATVGGQKIGAVEFDQLLRQQLSRQSLDVKMAYQFGMIDQLLNGQIANVVMTRAAHDLGLVISDDMVARQVNKILDPFIKGSDETKKEALQRVLRSQGMSEAQFATAIRTEMTTSILRTALQAGTAIPLPQETADLYRAKNEERTIKAVVFPDSSIKDFKEPDDDILKPIYQAGQERYAIPETRALTIAILSKDSVKEGLTISDDELKAAYENNKDGFTEPERRVLQQAILPTEDEAKAVAEAMKKGAKSLKDALAASKAKPESYRGEDTFLAGGLVKDIADPAFAAEKSATVGPIKTALGWHVLHVKDIKPPYAKSFDEMKETLRKDLLAERMDGQMLSLANSVDDQIAGGASLDDVAKEQNMTLSKTGFLLSDGSTPDNHDGMKDFDSRDRATILETAFQLAEGESSPVQELNGGRYAVVRTDQIKDKSYKPFDDVKAELRKTWISDQKQVLNKQRAQDVLGALVDGSKTMDSVAKEHGLKIETLTLTQSAAPQAPLIPAAKTIFFDTPKNQYAAAPGKDSYIVAMVSDTKLPDPAKASKESLKDIEETAMKGTQDEFMLTYLDHMQDKIGVKVNNALLQKLYGPGSE